MDFKIGQNFKNISPDWESAPPICASFQVKRRTLIFSAQICPKTDLGLQIQKTNVGIRIISLRYHVCQFSAKTDDSEVFGPNLAKNGFRFENSES